MSSFVCPHCGEREEIFGSGGGLEAAETLGVPLFAQVPLLPALREGGDVGRPIVVTDPDAPASIALVDAARAVAKATKTKIGKPLTLLAGSGAPAAPHHH
jgi:ATP-binding protein involved in chromosome partitioning